MTYDNNEDISWSAYYANESVPHHFTPDDERWLASCSDTPVQVAVHIDWILTQPQIMEKARVKLLEVVGFVPETPLLQVKELYDRGIIWDEWAGDELGIGEWTADPI